jgi:hypothetical protein
MTTSKIEMSMIARESREMDKNDDRKNKIKEQRQVF